MKKIILMLVMGVTAIAITSCKKEGCTDETALNYDAEAKEDNGTCEYFVPDPRDAVVGKYVTEDSAFFESDFVSEQTYTLTISYNPDDDDEDRIYLEGLWGSEYTFYAGYLNGTFLIPDQLVYDGYTMSGEGQIFGNKVIYETSGNDFYNKGEGIR